MASTFSTNLAIELIGTGDQAGTWGVTTNTNLGTLIEQAISGYVTQAVSTGADTTITIPNGATGVARNMYIELTGTGGTNTNLIVPSNKKLYFIFNNTASGQVTVKVSGQTGVSVPNGKKMVLVCNGTDVVNGLNYIADFGTNSFTVTNLTATSATITNLIATTGTITTLSATSGNISNLVSSDASATVLRAASATLTHLSATSASITNLALTSLTISSLSITNVSVASATVSSNLTLSGGTANGVLYLNGSKVATSGSDLVFNATGLGVGTSPVAKLHVSGAAAKLYVDLGGNNYYQATDQIWQNYGGGTEYMRLTSTGLGIGTSSPTRKLTVFDTTNTQDYQLAIGNIAANSYDIGREVSSGLLKFYGTQSGANGYIFSGVNGERMRIDQSGNLGLGVTPSAWASNYRSLDFNHGSLSQGGTGAGSIIDLSYNAYYNGTNWLYKNTDEASQYRQAGGLHYWYTAASGTAGNAITFTTAMVLDASGNLGIGKTSPAYRLDIEGASPRIWMKDTTASGSHFEVACDTSSAAIVNRANLPLTFGTNNTERARITSGGQFAVVGAGSESAPTISKTDDLNTGIFFPAADTIAFAEGGAESMRVDSSGRLLVGTTTNTDNYKTNIQFLGDGVNGVIVKNTASSGGPIFLYLHDSAQTVNSTARSAYYEDSTTVRWEFRKNGGLANYQSNNVDLSDARTKKEITPAPSYWDKIGALEIVTYKYNDQTHDDVNLGVIAQQVESVEPVWVDSDGWGGETPEDGVPLKTVYTKDITFAAIKALQEAMARIESLEAKVAALEAK